MASVSYWYSVAERCHSTNARIYDEEILRCMDQCDLGALLGDGYWRTNDDVYSGILGEILSCMERGNALFPSHSVPHDYVICVGTDMADFVHKRGSWQEQGG
jgi:hypothetical protein